MSALRRYEILLPLRFNDGVPVPDELIGQSLLELRRQFGAITQEAQVVRGMWEHQGQLYRDELSRVFVDVEDNVETRRFFSQWKEQLKARFRQLEIYITVHPVERV